MIARSREPGAVLLDYLWPFWAYRDASRGTALERASALRYNQCLSRALPAYLKRWGMICGLLLSTSAVSPRVVACVAGVAFTVAICITLHIAHVYLLFNRH